MRRPALVPPDAISADRKLAQRQNGVSEVSKHRSQVNALRQAYKRVAFPAGARTSDDRLATRHSVAAELGVVCRGNGAGCCLHYFRGIQPATPLFPVLVTGRRDEPRYTCTFGNVTERRRVAHRFPVMSLAVLSSLRRVPAAFSTDFSRVLRC